MWISQKYFENLFFKVFSKTLFYILFSKYFWKYFVNDFQNTCDKYFIKVFSTYFWKALSCLFSKYFLKVFCPSLLNTFIDANVSSQLLLSFNMLPLALYYKCSILGFPLHVYDCRLCSCRYFRCPLLGGIVIFVFMLASSITTGVITYVNHYPPSDPGFYYNSTLT